MNKATLTYYIASFLTNMLVLTQAGITIGTILVCVALNVSLRIYLNWHFRNVNS